MWMGVYDKYANAMKGSFPNGAFPPSYIADFEWNIKNYQRNCQKQ